MVNFQDHLQAQNVKVIIINNENLWAWTLTLVLDAAIDLLSKLTIALCLSGSPRWILDKVWHLVDLRILVIFYQLAI